MSVPRLTEIIEKVFDSGTEVLKTSAEVTVPPIEVSAVEIKDAVNAERKLVINADGSINTSIATIALATGAATEAKQDTGNTSLSNIDGKITTCNTGAVTISASLPAGTNNIGDVDVLTLPALTSGTNIIGKVGIDQTTDGTTNKVASNLYQGGTVVSATNPVIIKSNGTIVSANFTRPNDTNLYTALDVISNSTSSPSVITFSNVSGIAAGNIIITSIAMRLDEANIPAGESTFRLHLYDAAPTAINDNAAYDLPSGDRAKYLGYLTLSTPIDLGATCWSQDTNVNFQCKLAAASTSLYGILQTVGGFTPVAQTVYTIQMKVVDI